MKIRKCIRMFLLVAILAIGMLGCGSTEPVATVRESPPVEEPVTDEVTMTVKEGSVSEDGLVLIMSGVCRDHVFRYGEVFFLEQYVDGAWTHVNKEPVAFNAVGYSVGTGESNEHEIRWEHIVGSLPSGEYRVVKYVQKHLVDAGSTADPVAEYTLYARFSL